MMRKVQYLQFTSMKCADKAIAGRKVSWYYDTG